MSNYDRNLTCNLKHCRILFSCVQTMIQVEVFWVVTPCSVL